MNKNNLDESIQLDNFSEDDYQIKGELSYLGFKLYVTQQTENMKYCLFECRLNPKVADLDEVYDRSALSLD